MVKVIAHRGASAYAPENTLAAFEKAIEQKADIIELDVRPTLDQKVVVFHDAKLNRTTDKRGFVRMRTLGELKQINAGRWFGFTEFKNETIPTFDEVLNQTEGKCELLVEIKSEGTVVRINFIRNLMNSIIIAKAKERVIVQSFDTRILNLLHKYYPGFRYQKLIVVKVPGFKIQLDKRVMVENILRKNHYESINVDHRFLTKTFIDKIHRNRKQVYCWTVNDPNRMKKLIELGVDGIITNHPDILHSVIAEKFSKEFKIILPPN